MRQCGPPLAPDPERRTAHRERQEAGRGPAAQGERTGALIAEHAEERVMLQRKTRSRRPGGSASQRSHPIMTTAIRQKLMFNCRSASLCTEAKDLELRLGPSISIAG
jgi:hypothetical protein